MWEKNENKQNKRPGVANFFFKKTINLTSERNLGIVVYAVIIFLNNLHRVLLVQVGNGSGFELTTVQSSILSITHGIDICDSFIYSVSN